jgi:hypothetical protein
MNLSILQYRMIISLLSILYISFIIPFFYIIDILLLPESYILTGTESSCNLIG